MNYLKLLLLITIPFFATSSLCGQRDSLKWLVMYSPSIEANDTRLYDWPAGGQRDILSNEDDGGVLTHSLVVFRNILSRQKTEMYAGIGYAKKINKFSRPYDHCFDLDGDFCTDVIRRIEEYRIDLVQLPFQGKIFFLRNLAFTANVIPEFSFRKVANPASQNVRDTHLEFYALEINPGLSFETRRFSAGFAIRAFQLKKIDRVLFIPELYDLDHTREARLSQKNETYNPFKLSLMVGYKL